MQDKLLALDTIDTASGVDSWHVLFTAWAGQQPAYQSSMEHRPVSCAVMTPCPQHYLAGPVFYDALKAWLQLADAARFKDDIRFVDAATPRAGISSSRVHLRHVVMPSSQEQVLAHRRICVCMCVSIYREIYMYIYLSIYVCISIYICIFI